MMIFGCCTWALISHTHTHRILIPGGTGFDLRHLYKKGTFKADGQRAVSCSSEVLFPCENCPVGTGGFAVCTLTTFYTPEGLKQVSGHSADMDAVDGVGMACDVTGTGLSIGSLIAKAIPTQRKCTVELMNESSNYTLRNPRVYVASGRCTNPLPPAIGLSATGEASFVKPQMIPRGSSGIFTYDLFHNPTKTSSSKIAVLFQVPFDLNLKSNVYAVGIYDIGTECNQALFKEMYKSANTKFVRGKAKGPSLTHQSQDVTIMATMSDCYESVIKVHVCED